MATFDQLSAEQRAIIELVLKRGQSYDRLADLLAMPEARVRELARSALEQLSPLTAAEVDQDWRGQIADYMLGQQTGPEATATRGHLRRSEAARAWARSLVDSLENLYDGQVPQVPTGERVKERRRPERPRRRDVAEAPPPAEELSPEARAALRRRRLAGGLAAVGLVVVVLVLAVTGVFGGDDGEEPTRARAPAGAGSRGPAGLAIVAARGRQQQVIVQAAGLSPSRPREAYEVWLYNSPRDARSLGAQVTDSRGTYQGAGALPSNYRRYRFIDISLERIDENRAHSGKTVLRGRIGRLRSPRSGARGRQGVILGQVVLTPP